MNTQTVFRSTHVRNYTVFSNELIANAELSWKAKGILMYLLSKPVDWQTRLEDVVKHGKDGREAVLSGIKELKEAGYLKKVRVTDPSTKRVVRWETHVFEHPQSEPDVGNPDSGFPGSGKPDATKYGSTNSRKQNKDQENTEKLLAVAQRDRDFESSSAMKGEVADTPGQPPRSGGQKEKSSAKKEKGAAPRKKWQLGQPLPVDRHGYVVLPKSRSDAAHDWGCVAIAKKKAVLWTQRDIAAEYGDQAIEISQDDNGEYWVDTINGEEHESEVFAKNGELPLKKLRDVAIHGLRGSFLSQDGFNQMMQEHFEFALRQELAKASVPF